VRAVEPDGAQASARRVAAALYVSGVATLVLGIALGLIFDPLFYVIALIALVDFALARAFGTGRIGPLRRG
jgi:hypothetical protein